MESVIFPALALGFFGSAHCAVMCGPLALAACSGCDRGRSFGAYLAGRFVSYAFAGALLGAAGRELALPLARLQTVLTLAIAAVALARGVRLLAGGGATVRPATGRRGTTLLMGLVPRKGVGLGLVTGVLPCGLLAAAWTLAATSGSAVSGALTMTCFCAATTPSLAATVLAASTVRTLATSPRFAGACWCALAVLIAARTAMQRGSACH